MTERAKDDIGRSRDLLIDAAETLMREEGYAAVTSRRVATKAGLKPQLVHYYFATMDDLFLAVLRRLADDIIGRHDAVEHSSQPLRDLWNIIADTRYRLLIYEFVAASNHRKRLHGEFVKFGDAVRRKQIPIMQRVLAAHGVRSFPWTAPFASILLHSLARFLALESALGVSEGHADAVRAVDFYINRFDGPINVDARVIALESENAELRRQLAAMGGS